MVLFLFFFFFFLRQRSFKRMLHTLAVILIKLQLERNKPKETGLFHTVHRQPSQNIYRFKSKIASSASLPSNQ